MTDNAAMGDVVDFPARPAVLDDDADDLLTGPGPSADGAGDGGPRGPRLPAVPVPDDDTTMTGTKIAASAVTATESRASRRAV
jgi:hypothetical protein